jgi:hypothetical protein
MFPGKLAYKMDTSTEIPELSSSSTGNKASQ